MNRFRRQITGYYPDIRKFRLIIGITLLNLSLTLSAQQIVINANERPLNEVFFEIIEQYNLQLSYNDRQLSREEVTMHRSFNNPEDALTALLENRPYGYKDQKGIFIIFRKKPIYYQVSGRIMASDTHETLPFSHIIVNGTGIISDMNGQFFTLSSDSVINLTISYLGYYILDTVVQNQFVHDFFLVPSITNLQEVTIEGSVVEYATEIGDSPGKIRLNHKTASRLPGNGDNSVFNFLRLEPGILAAGESSSDLIIWGGYESHSKVLFDDFTLFGLKNFNDNISAINPYMAKDILVLKGGYGAEYGERVGGIVNITGTGGDKTSPSLNMNINNMTMNGMASIPVYRESALMIAFRRTYYNLYNPEDISLFSQQGNQSRSDIIAYPDYTFGDFNIKYSGESDKIGSYFVSLYQGMDNFSYYVDQERTNVFVSQLSEEESKQKGGTLHWSKPWSSGIKSTISTSYSDFNRQLYNEQEVSRLNNQLVFSRENSTYNSVNEATIHSHLIIPLKRNHMIKAGLEYKYNGIEFREQVNSDIPTESIEGTGRINGYLTGRSTILSNILFEPGLRIDIPLNISEVYLQPRIAVTVSMSEHWKSYAAWGIYNQFISQTSSLDDYGNYQYFWAVSDNIEIPVLQAVHYVGGISYQYGHYTFSAETYYKNTEGLTRYVRLIRDNIKAVFEGESRSYGMDLFMKAKWRKHEGWISYSLSKTEEYFEYFPNLLYRMAPHDQRHEIKTAILLNFSPIYLSANYVYGSGFITPSALNLISDLDRYPYSRLDAAIFYRFGKERYRFEAGLSILNLSNRENIKFSNFIKVPSDQLTTIDIHAEAVPFTPTLYLNLSF